MGLEYTTFKELDLELSCQNTLSVEIQLSLILVGPAPARGRADLDRLCRALKGDLRPGIVISTLGWEGVC